MRAEAPETGLKRSYLIEFGAYDALPIYDIKDKLMALTFLQAKCSAESRWEYHTAIFLYCNTMCHKPILWHIRRYVKLS